MAETVEHKTAFSEAEFNRLFPVVEIEAFQLSDKCMQFKPKTERQIRVYNSIVRAKTIGMKNFRVAAIAPSLSEDGQTIIYREGMKPAVGKSPMWWKEALICFMPRMNSRMARVIESDVRLGTIIKYLVEEGYEIEDAWNAVCDDSRNIGNYSDSENTKHELELTGSRPVGKWCDLGNVFNIISNNTLSGFWITGGCYKVKGKNYPLAYCNKVHFPNMDHHLSIGLLVMDVV